ncbi:MAG: FAD-dependent oxidoreductase [Bryobacteraceae bacterium]
MTTRRDFLSAALVGLTQKSDRTVAGGFVNESHVLGHRLRDRASRPAPSRRERVPWVIVGGGVAGLAAAWRLEKRGFDGFVVLEMEREPGGNSRWGENEISAYPWAAHYVPVPQRGATLLRELFDEIGLLPGGEPDERHLCHSPQERLFLHGRWQEGLEPSVGATRRDHEQFDRFGILIEEQRATGQFTIPLATGAQPSPLDRESMAAWMARHGLDSPYLRWYIDYACRDDYGALATDTSAWAGVHYFASREGTETAPFTWPEGNGWIVKKLLARLGRFVRASSPVWRIARDGLRYRVVTENVEYTADAVIFAAPTFLAPYLVENAAPPGFVYSPWLTANLTLDRLPRERNLEPAWDNVIYDSPSLGYVVATHQNLVVHQPRSVWTYYLALAHSTPAEARRALLDRDWRHWKDAILNDLARAHPDIRACVSRVDVMRMGHAMSRPVPGFLSRPAPRAPERFWFANSDLSGISIFEEAQYRGVRAADAALRALG